MSLLIPSSEYRQSLLPSPQQIELEETRALRQRVSRLASLCCFFPCLPITCCRVFCPYSESEAGTIEDSEERLIRRCWNIGHSIPRELPENRLDLFCQAISLTHCDDTLSAPFPCLDATVPFEYLYGPERQKMETFKNPSSQELSLAEIR